MIRFASHCSQIPEHLIHLSGDSITLSDSVLVKVSGMDDEAEKDVLVSWSLQVSGGQQRLFVCGIYYGIDLSLISTLHIKLDQIILFQTKVHRTL